MNNTKFVFRFLTLNFGFLALPLLVATTISLVQFYEKQIEDGREKLQQIARLRANSISEWLPPEMPEAKELIYFFELGKKEVDYGAINKELEKLVAKFPGYLFAVLGKEAVSGNFHEILAASDQKFAAAKNNIFWVNPIYLDRKEGVIMRYYENLDPEDEGPQPYLIGLQAFHDEKGELAGFVVEAVAMKYVMAAVFSTTYFTYLDFAIVDDESIVMASSDSALSGHYFEPIDKKSWERSKDLGTIKLAEKATQHTPIDAQGIFDFSWKDKRQFACQKQIPQTQLSLIVFTPKGAFFARALNQYALLYIVYVAILIIGVFIVISVGMWISRSLRQLSSLMDAVSRGDLAVRFTPQPFGYEINFLGEIFNSTLTSIQTNIQMAEDERVKREVYQREVTLGREVQKGLFPDTFPKVEGVDLAGCYIPSDQASGDFYLIEKHEKGLLIALFDIGGKGIHSSLYGISVRSLLRTYATWIDDVGDLMSKVNADFVQESTVQATAFVAFLDSQNHKLLYTSCGHPPALIKRAAGELVELEAFGQPLGENREAHYETKSVDLLKGDQLFAYVDGLTNAQNTQGAAIGIDGVKQAIGAASFDSAEAGVEALNRLWEEHTGEKTPADEILVLTCRINS